MCVWRICSTYAEFTYWARLHILSPFLRYKRYEHILILQNILDVYCTLSNSVDGRMSTGIGTAAGDGCRVEVLRVNNNANENRYFFITRISYLCAEENVKKVGRWCAVRDHLCCGQMRYDHCALMIVIFQHQILMFSPPVHHLLLEMVMCAPIQNANDLFSEFENLFNYRWSI